MEYIKKFETQADRDSAVIEKVPCVIYVEETDDVEYKKTADKLEIAYTLYRNVTSPTSYTYSVNGVSYSNSIAFKVETNVAIETSEVVESFSLVNGSGGCQLMGVNSWTVKSDLKSLSYAFNNIAADFDGSFLVGKTSNVTSLSGTFFVGNAGGTNLTIDLSNWNVSKVTTVDRMFMGATKVKTIILNGWKFSNKPGGSMVFRNCASLTNIYLNDTNSTTLAAIQSYLTANDGGSLNVSGITITSDGYNYNYDGSAWVQTPVE